ncbi:uncharacterized protein PHALS_15489 [Plasmopara halstedii]|uniref:Uncharacterized protein n=1 Tax=Plasmopara halstedii TaxID=4781 RepID=A0A0P1AJJ3_PLAHL|nr:uncharacterized protein PHALS_15489 [Plasmopara halstedii]CEG41143.1 hypothetical protein PHALS_15489 [Plasmopara halstedii]|eukprot:XP_024577512.1 hypothetical protein PHALS_15489 [Plasmopara halstedii]
MCTHGWMQDVVTETKLGNSIYERTDQGSCPEERQGGYPDIYGTSDRRLPSTSHIESLNAMISSKLSRPNLATEQQTSHATQCLQ